MGAEQDSLLIKAQALDVVSLLVGRAGVRRKERWGQRMRSWKRKERERTQSHREGRWAPGLHRPRAGDSRSIRPLPRSRGGSGEVGFSRTLGCHRLGPCPRVYETINTVRQRKERVQDRATGENCSPGKTEACPKFQKL